MAHLVYLTRHGLTEANVRRVRAGLTDIPLLPEGREQAVHLAERIGSFGVSDVRTSPLRRAFETARVIADKLEVPVIDEPGLIEVDVGPWEGLGESDVETLFPDEYEVWKHRPTSLRLPGHESIEDVRARAVPVIDRLLERDTPSLCVTHLGVIRVLILHYSGRPLDEYGAITFGHCELLSIRREGGSYEVCHY